MLLVQDARVLLLDEPVAGMSQDERTATGELLQRIARARIVLVVEHDMDFMRRFAIARHGAAPGQGALARAPSPQVQADPQGAGGLPRHCGAATTAAMSAVPDEPHGTQKQRRTDMLELNDIQAGYGRTQRAARRDGARPARSWPCSATTAPASRRCCASRSDSSSRAAAR